MTSFLSPYNGCTFYVESTLFYDSSASAFKVRISQEAQATKTFAANPHFSAGNLFRASRGHPAKYDELVWARDTFLGAFGIFPAAFTPPAAYRFL
jgi:hypothetical protein